MNPGFHKLLENTFVVDVYKIRPINRYFICIFLSNASSGYISLVTSCHK